MTNMKRGRRSERRRPQRDGRLAVGGAAGGAAASNGAPREAGQKTQLTRDRNPEELLHFLLTLGEQRCVFSSSRKVQKLQKEKKPWL